MKNNSTKFNNIYSSSSTLVLFLIGGFLAGFLALFSAVLIDFVSKELSFFFWLQSTFLMLILLVLLEEIIKFSLINFLLTKNARINISNIFEGLFLGLGFGLFELVLILFQNSYDKSLLLPILLVFVAHSLTSVILLISSVYFKNSQKLFIFYFLLAFSLHLIYNLNVV